MYWWRGIHTTREDATPIKTERPYTNQLVMLHRILAPIPTWIWAKPELIDSTGGCGDFPTLCAGFSQPPERTSGPSTRLWAQGATGGR